MKFEKLYAQNVNVFQISAEIVGDKGLMDNLNRSQAKIVAISQKQPIHREFLRSRAPLATLSVHLTVEIQRARSHNRKKTLT